MSTFLVTGGAGFIGSSIVDLLLEKNQKVVVFDNSAVNIKKNLYLTNRSNLRIISPSEASILNHSDLSVVFSLESIDYVFHEAAQVSVTDSIKNPQKTMEINVEGTKNVLAAAKDHNVKKVILASSAAVYGNSSGVLSESSPALPISPYGQSKLELERLAKSVSTSSFSTVCLRYFNVYGPRQNPNSPYSGVISKFANRALDGLRPTIFGDGQQTRDFIFVRDVARANWLAANNSTGPFSVFNVASGRSTSLLELIDTLSRLTETRISPAFEPVRAGDIKHSTADVSSIKKNLGFVPEVTLEMGLKETLNWIKQLSPTP
ncbi:NAD-dependent epimerase/dehydratase family protein [Candidatus Micrarchaeota archaeon]|nr:NAD-dependent epimerase/dehydratase family protein [Candidatus Micrarchaeota archaeon]